MNVLLPRLSLLLALGCAHFAFAAETAPEPTKAGLEFFEKNVRPILAEHCYKCHSIAEKTSKGGLILDSRDGMLKGGDEGPAVVPGNPAKSLLLRAITYTDNELQMPPKKAGGKIPDAKIKVLQDWVKMGAPAPVGAGDKLTGLSQKARDHWAFKPVVKPAVPEVKNKLWVHNPIDAFVLAKLEAVGLQPNPTTNPESLLRRIHYDLVGLPPAAEKVYSFSNQYAAAVMADAANVQRGQPAKAVDALIAKEVDELLASPHYGERWARHWLDTARYSDTRGLAVDQGNSLFEDYRYAYAWTFRNYVIDALNTDKPYDQFIIEQLAADRLPDLKKEDPRLAALGFITVGKRFDNKDDTIDERIDTTTKAFLGLTVACSRCHDHKFDPIPAADYYSLHGIFASTIEPLQRPVISSPDAAAQRADFEKRLKALQEESAAGFYEYIREMRARYNREMAGRLVATTFRRGSAEWGDVNERYKLETPLPDFEPMRVQIDSPITGPFARCAAIPVAEFAERAPAVIAAALADKKYPVNPLIAAALRDLKPKTIDDVALAYQKVYNDAKDSILAHIARCAKPGHSSKETTPAVAQLANYPWPVPDVESILDNEELIAMFNSRKFCNDWQNRPIYGGQNNRAPARYFRFTQINELRLTHPGVPREAMAVADAASPRDSYVYLRGDRNKRGPVVPRQFLEILSTAPRKPFTEGSGRLELARSIASKDNPLTARVAMNRVWLKHFGEGFVSTPDDFGNMSEKPSHPELLDWLASEFTENGWSLKRMHRLIMTSATYRLDSNPNVNPLVVRKGPVDPLKLDAGNRLLWRANLHRLDFESIRDSMLKLTGKLSPVVGGQPANITDEPYSYRRSIYGYVDRLRLNDTLSQFDYADPDMTNSKRGSTIVPQQALFFMNNPLSVEVARAVAARPEVVKAMSEDSRINAMFLALFQRRATPSEIRWANDFLSKQRTLTNEAKRAVASGKAAPTPPGATPAKGTKTAAKDGKSPETKGKSATAVAPKASPAAKTGVAMKDGASMMEGGGMMMEAKTSGGAEGVLQNVGEMVSRNPLTPIELLAHALLLSNEFVYVN
ncbi:MAG: PSD1 and planctomycete cytochrome C domain-containing protein [Verrucomicrobiae bacterium]|jgi:hypothetical protein|nr:PSD1 and planctomycete cytochrome C domain-containing protein [Verrucomicrobiae bacterium]